MRVLLIFAALFLAVSCSMDTAGFSPQVCDALEKVDKALEEKETYVSIKKQHIEDIRASLSAGISDEDRYSLYDRMYEEYYQYNIDSAIFYARLKFETAVRSGIKALKDDSLLDLADRYVLSGMFTGAWELMKEINVSNLEYKLRPRYYHIYNSLYNGMYLSSDDPVLRQEYRLERDSYRKFLLEGLGTDDISRLYVLSEIMIDEDKAGEVLPVLLDRYNSTDISIHEKAVLSYIIGAAYLKCGNTEQAILHYAESAENDLKTPVNEYRSLYELAALLYENGDIVRAYRYITRSVDDAMTANASINIQSINGLLPIISSSYNIQMRTKQAELRYLLIGISIFAALFVLATLIAVKLMKNVSVAEKNTREKNDELQRANAKLQDYISRLQESNNIKESYLGRYLDLCSEYIESLERYRSRLRKTARDKSFADVKEILSDNTYLEKELQEFYSRFDATFLHIFPDFVKQLNSMLQPDRQIDDKSKDGILSTELRIAALIRLGVDDSVRISHFLRRSVSTVYNYRVKMRNAAISNREDFEKRIMEIGRVS